MTRMPAALATALLCAAATARAQHHDPSVLPPPAQTAHIESPQHFAFEIKFGPYLPDVDSEFSGGARPYHDTFGDDDLFHTAIEFDWEYLRIPGGTLAIGLGVGFMQAVGPTFTATGGKTGEDTVLNVLPVHFAATFRFDLLAANGWVPLVPYVKGGISLYYWWVLNGGGTAGTDADPAWGYTPGWFFAPGVMLQLDFFEPSAAKTFDTEFGVNHSYLFFEGMLAWIDDFGSGAAMALSDMTWVAGLAFEF